MKQSLNIFSCFFVEKENTTFRGELNSNHFSLEENNRKRNRKNAKGDTASKTAVLYFRKCQI